MCTAGQRVSLTITGPGPSFFSHPSRLLIKIMTISFNLRPLVRQTVYTANPFASVKHKKHPKSIPSKNTVNGLVSLPEGIA